MAYSWAFTPASPKHEAIGTTEKQSLINIKYTADRHRHQFLFYMLLMVEKCLSVYKGIFFLADIIKTTILVNSLNYEEFKYVPLKGITSLA